MCLSPCLHVYLPVSLFACFYRRLFMCPSIRPVISASELKMLMRENLVYISVQQCEFPKFRYNSKNVSSLETISKFKFDALSANSAQKCSVGYLHLLLFPYENAPKHVMYCCSATMFPLRVYRTQEE